MNRRLAVILLTFVPAILQAADQWTDVSSAMVANLTNSGVKLPWPGGCSGVVANRLNGDVVIKVVGQGLWRSSDQGATWKRIDNNTVSGRDETGWATTVDQNAPRRMASFSLDGLAGWTTNGTDWKSFSNNGRNWDYGSVDWATPAPRTILAAKHETSPLGEVDLSIDGGVTWKKLEIRIAGKPNAISMLGVMDATTFVYCNSNGIHRSTDSGVTLDASVRGQSTNADTRSFQERALPWDDEWIARDQRQRRDMAIAGKPGEYLARSVFWRRRK